MRNSINLHPKSYATFAANDSSYLSRVAAGSRWAKVVLSGVILTTALADYTLGQQPRVASQTPVPAAFDAPPFGVSSGYYRSPSNVMQASANAQPRSVATQSDTPTQFKFGKEPEGKLLSSKIISSSPPVIVSDGTPTAGPIANPAGKLTSMTGISEEGMGYGFEEASSIPGTYGVPIAPSAKSHSHRARMAPTSPVYNACIPEDCRDFYGSYEAVYLQRTGDQTFSLSRNNPMTDYDFEFGNRITLGRMLDCTDGVELVYTGPFNWQRTGLNVSTTGDLQSVLTAAGGYLPGQIDTFNNASAHVQDHRVRLQSYEANRRWFAWDVVNTLIGIRAIQFEENLAFNSVAPDQGVGVFRSDIQNFLLGFQIGADVMRPISQRFSLGTRSRLGGFLNFNDGSLSIANRGTTLINAARRDTDLSGMIQVGVIGRYRIFPKLVATAGYELMYLVGVGTASNQNYTPVNPSTGAKFSTDDSILLQGGTFGLELSF